MMKQIVIVILLVSISYSSARLTGATNTSCYTHLISHRTILQMYDVVNCTSSNLCTDVTLSVSCPKQQNSLQCCENFASSMRIMYTSCRYLFQFTPTTNLGFLLQAREIPESQMDNPSFNPNSAIIGTWDSGTDHQQLYCRNSSTSSGTTFPNSVTHTGAYRADDVNAPSSINITWYSPNSTSESIYIAFTYTISRDVSTNFHPYTASNLVYRLEELPEPTTEPATEPATATSQDDTDPETDDDDTAFNRTTEATTAAGQHSCGSMLLILAVLLVMYHLF